MAVPATNGIIKGIFKFIILPILILILLVVIAGIVVLSLTPEQLKIADIPLGDDSMTFRSLGLADVKLFNIIKMARDLMKEPTRSDMVSNPPNTVEEKGTATANTSNSNVQSEDGKINYLQMAGEPVTYDKEYFLTYKDTTIAYLFDQMINQAKEEGDSEDDAVKMFKELHATVEEIIISVSGSERTFRVVVSINTKQLVEEALKDESLPAPARWALNQVPNRVYLISVQKVNVDSEGKMVLTYKSLMINGQENQVSEILFKMMASGADNPEGKDSKVIISEGLGEGLSQVISNLGKIGTATADENNVVTGNVVLGNGGLLNGKITVITYTPETAPAPATE